MKKVICAGLLVIMMGIVGAYAAGTSTVAGLVISASDTSIEIKKKAKEYTLYWTGESKVLVNGREADRGAVAICQKVEASYVVRDGRRELVRVEILQESYCAE